MKISIDSNNYKVALSLFNENRRLSTDFTLNMAIKACTKLRDFKQGLKMIQKFSSTSLQDPNIQTSLIHFYMQSGKVNDAYRLFSSISKKTNVVYSTMFKGFLANKTPEKALDLYEKMEIEPNRHTPTVLLNVCAHLSDDRAKSVGRKLVEKLVNFKQNDNALFNSGIHMLMRFGDVKAAEDIFSLVKNKDIYSYGVMIKGYITNAMCEKALDLFESMKLKPNDIIHTLILDSCAQLANDRAKAIGNQLIHEVVQKQQKNHILLTAAIHMLFKFGDISQAELIFQCMDKRDTGCYNVMMKGYNENGMFEKCLDLLETIDANLNEISYAVLMKSCAELCNDRSKIIGQKLWEQMPSAYRNNVIVLTSALHMFTKFGDINAAEDIFQSIRNKDVACYNALMNGYNENGMFEKCLDLLESIDVDLNEISYAVLMKSCAELCNDRSKTIGQKLWKQMPSAYRDSTMISNTALQMLLKFGDITSGERLFQALQNKSIVTYVIMMSGYNMNHEPLKCLNLFDEMKRLNLTPNEFIFASAIAACAQIGIISRCESIVNDIPAEIQEQRFTQSSLINMWGKSGSVARAQKIFEAIADPDIVTVGSMVNAYGLNGMGTEAVELYKRIPKDTRDDVLHICVLNACSHSGLLSEARQIFDEIPNKTEEITTVMIDCLSRLFLFDEAQKLIDDFERTNPPCLVMYMTMLSGARNHRNSQLAEKIYNRMTELFPDQKQSLVSGAILLANIYSSLGDHEKASHFRSTRRKELGEKVRIGTSWTEINGELVQMRAHDESHPRMREIRAELERLTADLIENGYTFDPSWITRPIESDETIQSVLCGHSEKLAIGLNLIQRPIPSPIQVTKNLRVCGDCHSMTKLIAKLRRVDIIVRDANRVHHFSQNGQCSCQDHF